MKTQRIIQFVTKKLPLKILPLTAIEMPAKFKDANPRLVTVENVGVVKDINIDRGDDRVAEFIFIYEVDAVKTGEGSWKVVGK